MGAEYAPFLLSLSFSIFIYLSTRLAVSPSISLHFTMTVYQSVYRVLSSSLHLSRSLSLCLAHCLGNSSFH